MIIVSLIGGLGNQMFQYAAGRSLALRNSTSLILDKRILETSGLNMTLREYELGIFNIDNGWIENDELNKFSPNLLISNTFDRFIGDLKRKYYGNSFYKEEKIYRYDPKFSKLKNNTYLFGYFQAEKYFMQYEQQIRNDFQFIPEISGKYQDYIQRVNHCNSIGIHFRRGDYVNNTYHNLCPLQYYYDAIKIIKNRIKDPVLFVFTDDYEWVISNVQFDNESVIIDSRNERSYEDLRLMSLCKHNIIANSSFSWWAAWLNPNKDKIVIAPKNWVSIEKINSEIDDLFPNNWITI